MLTAYNPYAHKGPLPTVVTTLFLFPNPTKTSTEFYEYAKKYLEEVENPIVFFTTTKIMNKIKDHRDPSMPIKFVEMNYKDIEARKKYGYDFWDS